MQSRRRSKSDVCEMRIVSNADWLSPEPVVPIKKMNSELLPITEPEVSFGKLGFRFVAQDFLRGDLPRVLRIGPTLTAAIPMATAIPMINCVLLLGMIASIHECDGMEIKSDASPSM
jgi:hypothetical protein